MRFAGCAYGVPPGAAEELPLASNAPEQQIKPEVLVRELLPLLQGISRYFTVRHKRLAEPLLVHYGLAQFPDMK